jgi:hypothetical protein
MDTLPIASDKFLESLSLLVHPKSRLLICFDKNCRHAISPNGSHPTNHLRDKHNIPLSRQKGLLCAVVVVIRRNTINLARARCWVIQVGSIPPPFLDTRIIL